MQSIIENLLCIARFENGSIKIKAAPLSIPALFERLIDETKTYAPGISFDTHIEVETVHTDAELLHQACTIIISNSVKFAGENAHITLSDEAVQAEQDWGFPSIKALCTRSDGSVYAENGKRKGAVIIMQLLQNNIYESIP